ncbi:hypothetical protein NKH34_30385 [Mesorhizobium sp. M1148]
MTGLQIPLRTSSTMEDYVTAQEWRRACLRAARFTRTAAVRFDATAAIRG